MPARILTVQGVERVRAEPTRRLELPDAALPGLYLIIQPSGAKSWAVRYRAGGKTRKLTLGTYPVLDLLTARSRAREALQAVSAGRDPGQEKVDGARARRTGEDPNLFSVLAEEYLKRHVRPKSGKRWAAEAERIIQRELLPLWGRRRVQEINRRVIIELLDSIVDRGSPVMANRVLAVVKKFFAWCLGRSVVEVDPCSGVRAPAAEIKRDRVLSDREVRLVWRAADRLGWPFGPLIHLLILTAQRREEVAGMRWPEVSGSLWSLPALRTKNKAVHDVPLSPGTLAVLSRVPRIVGSAHYVFTSNGVTPVSGFSRAKAKLDAEIIRLAREESGAELQPWRLHDLRRTAATGMARLGHPVHVVEAVLNHRSGTISGVSAIYNRHQYGAEKRAALETWAAHVASLTAGEYA